MIIREGDPCASGARETAEDESKVIDYFEQDSTITINGRQQRPFGNLYNADGTIDRYNMDLDIAIENGWVKTEGERVGLTLKGKKHLENKEDRGAEKPAAGAKKVGDKKRVVEKTAPTERVSLFMAKYDSGDRFKLTRAGAKEDKVYKLSLFKNKGKHEIEKVFEGSIPEIIDKVEDYFRK